MKTIARASRRFALLLLGLVLVLGLAIPLARPGSPASADGFATPMVAAGFDYTVGLKSDGTVVAVGNNSDGQCDVGSWTGITQVAAGHNHTVGLKSDGTVVAVGNNHSGQCDVSSWTGIVQVSAGYNHTVGLKSDGTVVAVGWDYYGQCDVGSWTGITQVAAGENYTVGLKSDGTVVAVGYNVYGRCDVGSWTDIVQVSAGRYHTVGLKPDGTVVAVGANNSGQCDVGSWTDIVQVSAGGDHTVGLRSDGTVVGVGATSWRCDVGSWTGIVQVSAGFYHTVGLKFDGTVVAVGRNFSECDVGSWTDIVQVSTGGSHTVGLKSDGTVVAVGMNQIGQCDVGSWTDIVQVSAGSDLTVGLKSDGTVVAVGSESGSACDVGSWTDIVQVSTGGSHTVGLKFDGTVVAVGWNAFGQCDVGSWTDMVQVSAASGRTVGLKSDGTVVAVGYHYFGECDVGSWTGIVQVSAGGNHTVGLKSDGTVMAVGDNGEGQCDVGSWTGIVQVAAGDYHTVGLKSDGTVVTASCRVGYHYHGQCEVESWGDILQVSAGYHHTAGLKSDGTVIAAGAGVELAKWNLGLTAPNSVPLQPSNLSPDRGATDVSLTPTFTSSAFSDPDVGDTHAASQWQMRTSISTYGSPLFDSGRDTANRTQINIPSGYLDYSSTYYWHVRHQDKHGAWSEWSTETLFTTLSEDVSNEAPESPDGLLQLRSNGIAEIPANGGTGEGSVVFKGTVVDPQGDRVKLQIELRRLDEYGGSFDETQGGLKDSDTVNSGSQAVIRVDGLQDAEYHWRARAIDSHGNTSIWVEFGGNAISERDFIVCTQLGETINHRITQQVTYPLYLRDPDSFKNALSILWLDFTSWGTQTGLVEKYDEFYFTGIDYELLKLNALLEARSAMNDGNIDRAEELLLRATNFENISNLSFQAAVETFNNSLDVAEKLAQKIRENCQVVRDVLLIPAKIANPTAARALDYVFIVTDGAIEYALGNQDQAIRDVIIKTAVNVFFDQVKFDEFGGRTFSEWVQNRTGKYVFPELTKVMASEKGRWILSQAIKATVASFAEEALEKADSYFVEKAEGLADYIAAELQSPGRLLVLDSAGKATGLMSEGVDHQVQRSIYDKGTVTVFSPEDGLVYQIVGTEEGTYGLNVTRVSGLSTFTFSASGIPTSGGALHQYVIDWNALSMNKDSVTVRIDSDGDGVFERIGTVDAQLTADEFNKIGKGGLPFWIWIAAGIGGLVAITAATYAIRKRREKG